VSSVN
jgi:hypothetical protein